LYIWDATRLIITNQINIHNAIINRLLFHPKCKFDKIELKDFFDDDDLDSNVLLTASQDGYAKV
jgi:hypothetical protein